MRRMGWMGLLLVAACEKEPASLNVEPKEFPVLEKKAKTIQLKAQTKDDRGIFIATVQPLWTSSDESVATVDMNGQISAVGTGHAEIKGVFKNVQATIPVDVKIIGSVELEPSAPQKIKMGKSFKTTVTVKDDKGRVLTGEKVLYRTGGYCVDVEADGTVVGQAVGECTVIAYVKDKDGRVKVEVVE